MSSGPVPKSFNIQFLFLDFGLLRPGLENTRLSGKFSSKSCVLMLDPGQGLVLSCYQSLAMSLYLEGVTRLLLENLSLTGQQLTVNSPLSSTLHFSFTNLGSFLGLGMLRAGESCGPIILFPVNTHFLIVTVPS